MMKKITTTTYLATFLWFTVFTFAAQAQVDSSTTALPFQIEEIESNGKTHTLRKQPYLVDINSTLRIKLDMDVIRTESGKLPSSSAEAQNLIEQAMALQKVAQQGIKNIKPLQGVLAGWADPAKQDVAKLDSVLSSVAENALAIIDSTEPGSPLYQSMDSALERALMREELGIAEQYQAVFEAALEESRRLQVQFDDLLRNDGIYYQLGAWISTAQGEQPLHLDGFDDYPEGELFEVARWNLTMTAEQKNQLQKLERTARELNETGIKVAIKDLANNAPNMLKKMLKDAFPCILSIEKEITRVEEAGGQTVQSISDVISGAKSTIFEYKNLLDGLFKKYTVDSATADGAELLASIKTDFATAKKQTADLVATFKAVTDLPDSAIGANSPLLSSVQSLKDTIKACENQITGKIDDIETNFRIALAGLTSAKEINSEVLQFGDEVKRHDIESLPDETKLNLKRTGVREAGDAIIIKFAYGKENVPRRVKDAQVNLYRIASHTDVVVSMIYARPQRNDKISGDFRLAPSYSVIFSWGCRSSVTYNTLFKPGIGISVAATDFNHDNTPEVGLGLVLSAFRNMLQAGIGYNLQEKVRYGFFGLHLPIPAITPSGG